MKQELFAQEELRSLLLAMDHQWFAAEDEGRTEDPTEHKIRKAKEEGRVAKSQDLASSVVLLFTTVTIAIVAPGFLTTCVDMIRWFLEQSTQMDITRDQGVMPAFLEYFLRLTLPVMVVGMVGAVVGNVVQVGFMFTTKPITPDFKKIIPNLAQYFKRAVFSVEAFYNLAKSFIKVAIISGIVYVNIAGAMPRIMNLVNRSFLQGFYFIADLTFQVLVQSAIVLLAMSFFDYWFQRRQHIESLKMTIQEVKQERKDYDGDPMVKSRMKQRMRQILTQNMMQEIPKADVVVTNPTHFAVALAYKQGEMEAPLVLAKGQDEIALKIREIAKEHNIPIIENKPLARALYAEVDVGNAIPQKFYEAVVVVLKQVYRLKKKQKEAV